MSLDILAHTSITQRAYHIISPRRKSLPVAGKKFWRPLACGTGRTGGGDAHLLVAAQGIDTAKTETQSLRQRRSLRWPSKRFTGVNKTKLPLPADFLSPHVPGAFNRNPAWIAFRYPRAEARPCFISVHAPARVLLGLALQRAKRRFVHGKTSIGLSHLGVGNRTKSCKIFTVQAEVSASPLTQH